MAHTAFNIIAAFILLLFIIAACFKKITPAAVITDLIYVGYSLVFEIILGDRLGLYYYISPAESTLYMILSVILIYIPINLIYLAFLPEKPGGIVVYTVFWIVGMLLFEYVSLVTDIVVFTGWRILPWSILTYIATYLLLNLLYRYLDRRLAVKRAA